MLGKVFILDVTKDVNRGGDLSKVAAITDRVEVRCFLKHPDRLHGSCFASLTAAQEEPSACNLNLRVGPDEQTIGASNMKITLEMTQVSKCDVDQCVYNSENKCNAKAVTIGDIRRPGCDTFFSSEGHCQGSASIAGVGACKVSNCQFNDDFECSAPAISVGYTGPMREVVCRTFVAR